MQIHSALFPFDDLISLEKFYSNLKVSRLQLNIRATKQTLGQLQVITQERKYQLGRWDLPHYPASTMAKKYCWHHHRIEHHCSERHLLFSHAGRREHMQQPTSHLLRL